MTLNIAAILAITAWVLFVILRLTMFPPRKEQDIPGPHNNWQRDKGGEGSSFYESGEGMTGGSDDGGY